MADKKKAACTVSGISLNVCFFDNARPACGVGVLTRTDSIPRSCVSSHLGADIANARRGEKTSTWLNWKWTDR